MSDVAKRDGETRRLESPRRYLPLALTLCVGVLVSVVASIMVRGWEQERIKVEFERQAGILAAASKSSLGFHLEVLHSIGSFFPASNYVDRQEFAEFVKQPLSVRPGIQALEWVPRVPGSKRSAFEAAARRDGHTDFRITERNARGQMVKAARREEYFPVYYLEPLKGNEAALGFDLASEPARLNALARARDTGKAAATRRITLVQETGKQYEVLVFMPIYRKGMRHDTLAKRRESLHGFALGVFRIGDLVEASLRGLDRSGIDVHLYDKSAEAGEQSLYEAKAPQRTPEAHPMVDEIRRDNRAPHWGETLDVGGRQWSLLFLPAPEYLTARTTWQTWGVLGGGLLFTALLGAYLFMALGRSAQVERLVAVRTAELAAANRELEERITERKRAEDALRETKERLSQVIESALDAVISMDAGGVITGWNPQAEAVFGWSSQEAVGQSLAATIIPARYREAHERGLRHFVATGEGPILSRRIEIAALLRDGREVPVELWIAPARSSSGTWSFTAFVRDITERKRAEEVLVRRTEQMLALREIAVEITKELDLTAILTLVVRRVAELIESQSGVVYLWDETSQFLSAQAWSGFGEWMSEVRLKLGEGVAGTVAQRREGMIVNDYRTSPYASSLFLERTTTTAVIAEPLLYHERLIGVLSVGETRRLFHEQDREILGLFSAQAAIAIENARLYAALGDSRRRFEELYNLGLAMQEHQTLQAGLDLILKGAQTILGFDRMNILLADPAQTRLSAVASLGVEEPLEQIYVPLGQEGGGIAKAFLERRDIVWEGVGQVPEAWRLAHPYSGIKAFRSRSFVIVPLIVRGVAIGVLGADNKLSQKAIPTETVRLLKTFASQAAVTIDNARLYDEVTGYAKELGQKVEERTKALRETQVQLIQSGKLAAVGTLAAGVAHELNQPLMVIRGYAQELLGDERIADEEIREDLGRIEAQTTRMSAIITHLRDFSRQSKGTRQVTDLNQVVTHALTFLGQQLKTRNIEVVQELNAALPTVWADPLQIEQILLNLVTNARDAMEKVGKGAIVIRTEQAGDGRVALSVTDTGPGIPSDLQGRIFDPFFTTKEVGKGTGLGLSICHGIAEEHGGGLRVESPVAEDGGARFTLVLPRSLRDASGGERG